MSSLNRNMLRLRYNRVLSNNWRYCLAVTELQKQQQQDRNYHHQQQSQNNNNNGTLLKVAAGFGLAASAAFAFQKHLQDSGRDSLLFTTALALEGKAAAEAGQFVDGMQVYTSDDVANHQDEKTGIWISYKNGVYDITEFVKRHPGGSSKIMLAAGGSVEPFWSLYAVHKQPEILALMEQYRVGNLAKGEETLAMAGNAEDPYGNEPRRHPVLQVRNQKPFNAEPPPALLVENYITPTEVFYVRNHLPVPDLDPSVENYAVEVSLSPDGDSTKVITLNLDQLKTKFKQYSVTASLQCAGNRRSEMNQFKTVRGLQWTQAAMGNATWTGPRLMDVLLDAGLQMAPDEIEEWQILFEGADMDPTSAPYGASIPLAKALDPRADVILALEMNGEPLNRDHGFPCRVVVPGTTGARWVKWLTRIELSRDESESHWQRNDYKSFNPSTDWEKVDFSKAQAIQEMPITSVICDPQPGETVKLDSDGQIRLRGYAWSGGGRAVSRVDVSTDLGITWLTADLIDPPQSKGPNRQWAWTRWQARLPVENFEGKGQAEVWVRAVDSSYNVQPENMDHIWNLRGLMAVGYHKIKVNLTK